MLLNLGGPDSLGAVRPFLYNLFSDREIIRLGPAVLQKPLARLISTVRSRKTAAMYATIGGKSPILDITRAQADALERALNEANPTHSLIAASGFKVFVGMRYWHPLIETTAAEMHDEGIRRVLALSLYPHYSLATTGSSMNRFMDAAKRYSYEVSIPAPWYRHPGYIDAVVDTIKKGLLSFQGEPAQVLFSAHSLPMSLIESGDPYVQHIRGTIGEITLRTDIIWHLSYQSKSGPVRWLSPSTEEKIEELARKGLKNLLIVPISFVSDHIETLYEIDILYRRLADDLGMRLIRAGSLNTHPLFIEALKDIVLTNVQDKGWQQ